MSVSVVVGRLDNSLRVEVEEGMSVLSALRTNGFTRGSNEVIQDVEGNEYNGDEEVEQGFAYYLVQKVKSGRK